MFSIGACYSKARDQYYSLLVNNCNLHLSLHSLTVPQILNQFLVLIYFGPKSLDFLSFGISRIYVRNRRALMYVASNSPSEVEYFAHCGQIRENRLLF